ncbi:MAG: hydrogenase expression/formation protein HypE [Desulfobacteraceae bacterium]|jgi:hydrogenase expression/formation protein HypE
MEKLNKVIMMDHGSGGYRSDQLIREHILPVLGNSVLDRLGDGAVLSVQGARLAFTTDSYVVDPIFFPGGSIGDLAVNGTVNDLSMCGAVPLYLSCALIMEEGFPLADLDRILRDMATAAARANVQIVTGDTKVVARGAADKIFITTSGIGAINGSPFDMRGIEPGDKIIVSGTMADHGIAILTQRENMMVSANIESDTAPLNDLVALMMGSQAAIKLLRDPTRGGLATILNEIATNSGMSIRVDEMQIPVKKDVIAMCALLGIDPLYVANEGKLVAVVAGKDADALVKEMRNHELGLNASVIGEVVEPDLSAVTMRTRIGGDRIIPMLTGEQLPRIC